MGSMLPTTELQARYKPGQVVSGFASVAVRAGRFVKIAGDKTVDGDYDIVECGAGERALGVSERDSAPITEARTYVMRRVPIARSGAIARMIAGAAISAGDEVQSDAQGRPVTLAAVGSAAAELELGAGNSRIKFTATDPGYAGNGISVALVDPAANNQALGVVVTGNDIVVNLATNGGGAITSTVALIIAAIAASGAASALVTAANGTGSNGTGVVVAAAATNLAGGHDPTTGIPLGQACMDAAQAGDIIEIALF